MIYVWTRAHPDVRFTIVVESKSTAAAVIEEVVSGLRFIAMMDELREG